MLGVCASLAVFGACSGEGTMPPDASPSGDQPTTVDASTDRAQGLDESTLDVADATSTADAFDAVSVADTPDAATALDGDAPDAAAALDGVAPDGACAAGQTSCAGSCVTLASDAHHCGACGNACPAGQSCVSGACATTCDMGRIACPVGASLLCVDLQTDANHCGTCDVRCPTDQACAAGRCACAAGQRLCSGACVDTQTDASHCGGCGRSCTAGQTCTAGACVCAAGATLCGGACTDTAADATNCGSCGVRCAVGQFCQRGRCSVTCDAPQTACGSGATAVCTTTASDVANCGACGRACPTAANATTTCAAGACGFTCASGFADCDRDAGNGCEADLRASASSCGACGTACPARANATTACASGACGFTCLSGFADCDANAANGCEVDLRASSAHCGMCGRACAAGQTCVAGACSTLCGNGRVDSGESCDTAIAAGTTGACPSSCGAAATCSTVSLARAGTCSAACETTAITGCVGGDGCCPSTCNAVNDTDCAPRCGNGAVESGETCDTAIAAGMTGACPTTCAPMGACSTARLTNGGTCTAACAATPITACAGGDGCCPSGCTMARDSDCGPCADECVLGATRCGTGGVQTCAFTDGCRLWGAPVACASGLSCVDGRCAGASLTVTASTELCGARWYTGDVVIQGGARVSCATGVVEIHARSISIDPASSIVVPAVAVDTLAGSGYSSGYYPYCTGSTYNYVCLSGGGGGGGGGIGGIGTANQSTYYCSGTSSCRYISPSSGSTLPNQIFDDTALQGGRGGTGCAVCDFYTASTCSSGGGRGGGAIVLVATNTLSIAGTLTANGESGTGGATGSGGGGGGTVLLRAPDIDLAPTANVQAAGGGGGGGTSSTSCTPYSRLDGGQGGYGALKLLYTTRLSNRATVGSGVTSRNGIMPPTVTSSTHPDPNRYYNDGFPEFRVAWTPPTTGLPGYLTAFGSSYALLGPTTGTFTTSTSTTIPASRFPGGGDYYFAAEMLDATGTPSAMMTAYRVRVNARPPTLFSVSHPDPMLWYPGRTVVISWTLPFTVASGNLTGVLWYRVDHVSNTPPGRSAEGWTRTNALSLSVTADASGAPLADGTWYVHLAAEDSMGNLTRAAGHYRVQLGTEPARTTFFGYVENAAGARQTGVTVTLEPYGLTATTDASGYFIFSGIYAGTYQMTVSRSGATLGTTSVATTAAPYTFRLP